MIYLDTSVALAALFGEPQQPPPWLWRDGMQFRGCLPILSGWSTA